MLSGSGTLDANGQATLQTSSLTVGRHTITASYYGDDNFHASNAPGLSQAVNLATSITVSSSQPNPSVYGQDVTFTANVSSGSSNTSGIPSGAVIFSADGTPVGSATLDDSGNASIDLSSLSVGNHSITAAYQGDAVFGSSTASAFTQTVNQAGGSPKNSHRVLDMNIDYI